MYSERLRSRLLQRAHSEEHAVALYRRGFVVVVSIRCPSACCGSSGLSTGFGEVVLTLVDDRYECCYSVLCFVRIGSGLLFDFETHEAFNIMRDANPN